MIDITLKQIPIGQYEYVDVTFNAANTDENIVFQLRVENVRDIRWLDVTQGGQDDGTVPRIYRVYDSPGRATNTRTLNLRCDVAGYSTRLLLFTERT